MNASDVVGRRIVRVIQQKFWNRHIGKWSVEVKGFQLDNGDVVSFSTTETGDDYAVSATVWKKKDLEKKEPTA